MLDLDREMERLIESYQGPKPKLYVIEARLAPGDDQIDLSVCLAREDAAQSGSEELRGAADMPGCRSVWVEYDQKPPRVFAAGDLDWSPMHGVKQLERRDGKVCRVCYQPAGSLVDALEVHHAPARMHWILSRMLQYGGLEVLIHLEEHPALDGVDVGGFGSDGRLAAALTTVAQMTSVDPAKLMAVVCWPDQARGRRVSHLKIKNASQLHVKAYLEQEAR